ncbi:MAG: Ig-like domain-containing protein [Pseudolabrys sp.]
MVHPVSRVEYQYDDARRQRTNQRNDIGYDRVPARNGSASVAGDAVLYQSQPGFTGQDSFTFTLSGSGPGGTGSSAVQVSVTVH